MIDSEKQHDFFWGDDVVGEKASPGSGGASTYLPLRSRMRTIGRDGPACELVLAARLSKENRPSELQRLCYTPRVRGSDLG
jgi:hypothetical protein